MSHDHHEHSQSEHGQGLVRNGGRSLGVSRLRHLVALRTRAAASLSRVLSQPMSPRLRAARMLAALQGFLLSLAIAGLLLSPAMSFPRAAMTHDQTVDAARCSPCCPQNHADDHAQCAMGSCAFHCFDKVAVEAAMTRAVEGSPTAAVPGLAPSWTGIEHRPPLRPPPAR